MSVNRMVLWGGGLFLASALALFIYERRLQQADEGALAVISLDGPPLDRPPLGNAVQAGSGAAASASTEPVFYTCPQGRAFAIQYGADRRDVQITIDGGTLTLAPKVAASGRKYSDGVVTFWAQGDLARIEIGGEIAYDGCRIVP